jgi:adenylate cyclase
VTAGSPQPDGSALAGRIAWRVWRATLIANLVGMGFIAIDAATISNVIRSVSTSRLVYMCGVVAIPYFLFCATMGVFHVRRRLRPSMLWLAEGRPPTSDERLQLTAQPRRIAAYPLIYWTLLPVWALPYLHVVVGFKPGALGLAKVAVAFGLSALISFALSNFLVERELRPVISFAFAQDPPQSTKSIGMFGRLVLAWCAACGTPLVAIAVTLVGLTPQERASTAPFIWGMSLLGMFAGFLVAATAARAITDPLYAVRQGMRSVEEGQLDFELPIDVTGEIGQLQVGFNRMVMGLRERERVREVFGRHVGAEVAKRALDDDFGLGGELREATTMFVDVIASTKLAQTRLPQDVVNQLNEFFEAVIRCVEAEGGLVNQFQGDGVLCVFGAPDDQPDHAARALRAARAVRREIGTRRPGGLDAAIGISSGKVVAGNVGGVHRYEYTVVGDSTNEASRLTERAKPMSSRTLASKTTIDLAGDEASHWEEVGTLPLRGRAEPTIAYEPSLDAQSSPT